MHVVREWIGNSPNVAVKHYLRVTDDPFGQAAMDGALRNQVQHSSAPSRTVFLQPGWAALKTVMCG